MHNIIITLSFDLDREDVSWNLKAETDTRSLIQPLPITDKNAASLGQFLDAITPESDQELSFRQIIASGTNILHKDLERRLQNAEQAAQKVSMLRKRLAEIASLSTEYLQDQKPAMIQQPENEST